MYTCKYCKREFEKRTQHQQHVANRLKTGTCRLSVADAKDMRIERMIQAFRERAFAEKEEVDEIGITHDDVEDWS